MITRSHLTKPRWPAGFTLIITLALLVLITFIALGMLTLSSTSLRSSSRMSDMALARSNARAALILAIGELQKLTGPDTRVTANAAILDPGQNNPPPVLGAWRSWEGTNHESSGATAGRPISPGNDYKAAKRQRFLSWLVSGAPTTLTNPTAPPSVARGADTVPLVSSGSVGQGADRENLQVHLRPSPISQGNSSGAIAWWVGGENQKARLPKPYEPTNQNVAGWSTHLKSHAVADPKPFRLDALITDPALADRAVSLRQADLISTPSANLRVSNEFFHDLSAVSTGLLTNTATGGWRKDLSLLTENWNRVPTSNQPFFRVAPGRDLPANIPTRNNHRPSRSLFYPWSEYRASGIPIYEHGAVSSWENLKDWATLYRTMGNSGTSINSSSTAIDVNSPSENFNFLHTVRRLPVIARVQWVFSHSGAPISPATTPPTFEPRLLVTPVITMWNPYNVTINSSPMRFKVAAPLPNAFLFRVGTVQKQRWNSLVPAENTNPPYQALYLTGGNAQSSVNNPLTYDITTAYSFRPGETLVFSPTAAAIPANNVAIMQPGFRKQGGHFFPLLDDNNNRFAVPGSTNINVEARFDAIQENGTNLGSAKGVGVYLDMEISGRRHLVYRMVYRSEVAAAVYPPINGLAQATLEQSSTDPQPFLTTIFGARTASRTHLAAKGLVQTNPLVNYTVMGFKDTVEYNLQWDYPGTDHPVNSPFDYSFERLTGAGSDAYPNTTPTNQGFIMSGFQSADGLTRCILAEIPTKPIQSLAELQHWDMRYENPIPPYAFNIIGNSDASPLLPANAVFNSANASRGSQDLQNDDFYCSNHVLFDDWFVSSIAPKSASLGAPGGNETLRKTFTDFVSRLDPLPNRAYEPLREDVVAAQTANGADALFTRFADRADSWQTIASRIEVTGMFNVNSTSVKAWRALLGHARNQRVPFVTRTGHALSAAQDHAISRFSIAGDTAAGTPGSAGEFSAASEFAGYRRLDEATLDRFATEMVREVRARGPFLSLAEFVNRQLSSGNLALAGTIQSALNALERDAGMNPFAVIQGRSKPSVATPLPAGTAQYRFPDAAIGFNAYGLPGWTRQADVLRPIAPILSARDDSFVIRTYGDARNANGTITARAWCEATVRRTREFVDPADAAEITTLPQRPINLALGRRYQVISFRWLAPEEV